MKICFYHNAAFFIDLTYCYQQQSMLQLLLITSHLQLQLSFCCRTPQSKPSFVACGHCINRFIALRRQIVKRMSSKHIDFIILQVIIVTTRHVDGAHCKVTQSMAIIIYSIAVWLSRTATVFCIDQHALCTYGGSAFGGANYQRVTVPLNFSQLRHKQH